MGLWAQGLPVAGTDRDARDEDCPPSLLLVAHGSRPGDDPATKKLVAALSADFGEVGWSALRDRPTPQKALPGLSGARIHVAPMLMACCEIGGPLFRSLLPGVAQTGLPLVDLSSDDHAIPSYLEIHYWWAYVHPNAVRVFERQWLASAILLGNYARLRDGALIDLGTHLPGRTLQVACVYGDLTTRLCRRVVAGGGELDIVDVLPVQLNNLRRKLPTDAPARMLRMDSTNLRLPDATYDRAIVFFLLHEQPESYRERTISELFRVVKPGGQIVIVDYARPRWWNPLRYVLGPLLAALEPFALDLWRDDITTWMPKPWSDQATDRESFFGGLYQKIVVTR